MSTKQSEVETLLGRKLTPKEVEKYEFYWTQVYANSYDLARKIDLGED
jgi:hypothetical protein